MTSPGVEALREAARLELARIYGQTQREHRSDCAQPVHKARRNSPQPVHDTERRESPAKTEDSELATPTPLHYANREVS